MAELLKSFDEIVAQVTTPEGFELETTSLKKGIDNYRVDVALSPNFEFSLRELIEIQVKRAINAQRLIGPNANEMAVVRDGYADMMQVTLHRTKTDLTPDEIRVLQFAVIKFIIQEVRVELDDQANRLEETLASQQQSGNKNLLDTQQKISWFRRFREQFQFNVIRSIMRALQREENTVLKPQRAQFLGSELPQTLDILFNPMLHARGPSDPMLQEEFYTLWPKEGAGFAPMNEAFEKIVAEQVRALKVTPLKRAKPPAADNVEPFDDLNGLFALQSIAGAAPHQHDKLSESLCSLEEPENLRLLFDENQLEQYLEAGKELGMLGGRGLKGDIRKLQKIRDDMRKVVEPDDLRNLYAVYFMREKMEQQDFSMIKAEDAVEAVAGRNTDKLINTINVEMEGGGALKKKLKELAGEADKGIKQNADEYFGRALSDWARFRLHLKYFRFAQRMFNRINLIIDEEALQLAKAGGKLYQLWDSEEIKEVDVEDDHEISRHAVIKVDIRGAADVTTAMLKQGLNPASFFSQRFFDPINECLETYGVTKVFVEGDGVTLATFEFSDEPTKWYCVSQAAGAAKEILDIVRLQNANSAKTGLPAVEIGVGISFGAEKPTFLFDEERSVMVSNVIGQANELSACSWRLRELLEDPDFNVLVFQVPEGEPDRGEKGQMYLRYNVNGIVLDSAAFKKLKGELKFQTLNVKLGGESQTMHVGRYPDVAGRERTLVVREGEAGIYRNGGIDEDGISALNYYEVLPNGKLATQVIKLAEKKAG